MLAILSSLGFSASAPAESIGGSYVEARSTPRPGAKVVQQEARQSQAVLAWQIRQGNYDGEKLDGQTIVAVVTGEPSSGSSFGHTKTVFFVDGRISAPAQQALVHLAKDLAPGAIHDAGTVRQSKLDVRIAEGCGCGAAVIECPLAKVRTRKLTDADKPALGGSKNEKPLGDVFSSHQAFATEYSFAGEQSAAAGSLVLTFTGSFSR
jgi:hypothetical protein